MAVKYQLMQFEACPYWPQVKFFLTSETCSTKYVSDQSSVYVLLTIICLLRGRDQESAEGSEQTDLHECSYCRDKCGEWVRALIAACGVIIMSSQENRTFIGGQIKDSGGEEGEETIPAQRQWQRSRNCFIVNLFIILGCCQKKSTSYCCYATFIFGVIFLILGLVILVGGQSILNNAILKTMALHKDTERSVNK